MGVTLRFSPIVFVFALGCVGKGELSSADEDLSGKVPVVFMGESQPHAALFDDTTQKRGYAFNGVQGDTISIFADGNNDLDTVVYLYEAMPKTGAPVGHYLARNDDTYASGWTQNALSSSIDSYTLPQTGTYVVVVRPYSHATGSASVWFSEDLPDVQSVLFPGKGSPVARTGFSNNLAVNALPISSDATSYASKASSDNFYSLARIQIGAKDLTAILADSNKLASFAFDVAYYSGPTPLVGIGLGEHDPATVTAIAATDAATTLDAAITNGATNADRLRQADAVLTSSMLGDGDFATSKVKVFHSHWDNSDDTWSETIVAADPATGEVRAVTYVSPP